MDEHNAKSNKRSNQRKQILNGNEHDKRNHYSHLFSHCGVGSTGWFIEPST